MKQKHFPKFPIFIFVGIIISFTLTAKMYLWWEASGTWYAIILAFFFLLALIFFLYPFVLWRTIVVDDKGILTIFKRFYKPIRINIKKSIDQIYLKENNMDLIVFKLNDSYVHISPRNYTKGEKLSEYIATYVKKKSLYVNINSE